MRAIVLAVVLGLAIVFASEAEAGEYRIFESYEEYQQAGVEDAERARVEREMEAIRAEQERARREREIERNRAERERVWEGR